MAFRPPKKQPQFADLKGILSQSKSPDNALYQTVQQIIDRLTQFQLLIVEEAKKKLDDTDAEAKYANKFASFITRNDDTLRLPNSIQLLAGTGIVLDYAVANKLTISSLGGASGYAPMSTGAEPLEIMSDGAGSVLMIGFSE